MGVQNSINAVIGSIAGAAIAADLAESKKEAKIDVLVNNAYSALTNSKNSHQISRLFSSIGAGQCLPSKK